MCNPEDHFDTRFCSVQGIFRFYFATLCNYAHLVLLLTRLIKRDNAALKNVVWNYGDNSIFITMNRASEHFSVRCHSDNKQCLYHVQYIYNALQN